MFWLFAQMSVLCAFAFFAGALLTWLPLRATIRGLRAELAHPVLRPALPAGAVVIPEQPEEQSGAEHSSEERSPEQQSSEQQSSAEQSSGEQSPERQPAGQQPEEQAAEPQSAQPESAQTAEPARQAHPAEDDPARSRQSRSQAVRPRAAQSKLDHAPHADRAQQPEGDEQPEAGRRPEFAVKGSTKSMIFHTPDSPYFKRMKGDVTFRSAAEAERAGYTRWRPRSAAPAR
ncbi:type IV secretory pathway VirB10-like protein [Saccharothrix tamanrassetensis]|uniref:Type IV secretory pathway VirB10-like protein n=1 Tax=Saccharothrix tamanrassetensis TaxID=1051531 RepID=A0A841CW80_9PSEU|nr:hypothetical protein [Saccharothrix tamanrassetensis]MBB5960215.1 type IV secretory pathway VirB10-like protein [Saccharothrix tamanrassetensis]